MRKLNGWWEEDSMINSFVFRNKILVYLLILSLCLSMTVSALAYEGTTLYNGCNGEEVRAMQQALIDLGYLEGKADGKFGDKTEEAVRAFQRKNGLTPDGLAGKNTRSLLESARKGSSKPVTEKVTTPSAYNEGTLYNGCRGEEVRVMQQSLIELGYLEGNADGIFGKQTEKAVRVFQRKHGLTIDGLAGKKTRSAIELEQRRRNAPMEMTAGQIQEYDETEGIDWAPKENRARQILNAEGYSTDGLNYIEHSFAPKGGSALPYDYYSLCFYRSKETHMFDWTYAVHLDPNGKLVQMCTKDFGGKKLIHVDDPTADDVNKDLLNKAKEEVKRFLKRHGYSSLVKKVSKLEVSQVTVSIDNEDIYYTFAGSFMIRVRVAPTLRVDYFLYNG